ncbi:MAG TPA: electron transfer flavoprotein subunit alpha/FixB family protein [Gaiellaceae bacterium]|nr:electron transfer flavoprotein subunit alpha/FixB family protein [Gaiellaceae bacterium]
MILAATWDTEGLGRAGLELLGAATRLGATLGEEVAFVSLAASGRGAAEQAGAHGAARAFVVEGGHTTSVGEGAVAVLAELVRELGARAALLPADEQGGEVAPRLAERLGATAITHAVAVEVADTNPVWTRPVFGGKALATVSALAEPVVATLRRGAFDPAEATGGSAVVETRTVPAGDGAVEFLGSEAAADGASLEDATVIVSGGAGLGSAEAFSELEELAGLLGGAVGASLAAVDAGWAPPERQVGLTGKAVSPDVYFAFGISGASQHLAGIGGAKAVVAVNTDPDAPIFRSARLGVVMDCRVLVGALLAELRRSA